jgi:copper(I)-binding protein
MIFNLEEPLNAGQKSTLTLHFAEEKNIEITLPIESIKRKKSMHHH